MRLVGAFRVSPPITGGQPISNARLRPKVGVERRWICVCAHVDHILILTDVGDMRRCIVISLRYVHRLQGTVLNIPIGTM